MKDKEFYTVRGYAMSNQDGNELTPSMEDYLEMIFRLAQGKNYTRINNLASSLNVQPPSATKMVQKLAQLDCVNYEKYGMIELTEAGYRLGKILLRRHNTLEKFLRLIGVDKSVLEDTEKIEHNFSHESLQCIIKFVEFVELFPDFLKPYQEFLLKSKQQS